MAATQLYANNAVSSLGGALASGATSLTVVNGEGARFPSPSDRDWFLCTLAGRVNGVETQWEIVKCTARNGDVLTVTRGQEGTSAQNWPYGTPVELRWTAGSRLAASAVINDPAGNLAATTAQAALNELDAEKLAVAGGTMTGNLTLEKDGQALVTLSGNDDVSGPQLAFRRARGPQSGRSMPLGSSSLAVIAAQGYSGLDEQGLPLWRAGARILARAAADFSGSQCPGELLFQTTPLGSTTLGVGMRLLCNGNFLIGGDADQGQKCQVTGDVHLVGASYALYVNGVKVVAARRTGWAAATGTATRTTFATGSVTTAQLAERVKAIIDDLIAHGLIGA